MDFQHINIKLVCDHIPPNTCCQLGVSIDATDLLILVVRVRSFFSIRSLVVKYPFMFPRASSPHFAGSVFAAHPYHALQHVCLDDRERQRQRLVKLFLILESFKIVREGWCVAIREERQTTVAPAPIKDVSTSGGDPGAV
ncbi:hypothetical protein H2248_000867 [Termitomyces sp. 'cryptogamus']|nr:hypothetical protein H2248_000867 [Termitomyces sp. 'cryptogamus']